MKIQKILQDMAMLEAEDCTQEKILRVLQEGLQAFSELEQQGGQPSTATKTIILETFDPNLLTKFRPHCVWSK